MALKEILLKNGILEEKCAQFFKYYEMLIDWNEKINLTAITDEDEVAQKHFLDSLNANVDGIIKNGFSVIDVGTGAGFPGIPLKINDPSLKLTLLDSLAKRVNFLNEVTKSLGLENVAAVHARAEELGVKKEYREKFDVCVSRAVANLATLSELCLPFVKCGGYFVSLKGPKAEQEVNEAQKAIKILGGEFVGIENYDVSDTDLNHNIVIIKKISHTPTKYPRKAPKPAKEPLL